MLKLYKINKSNLMSEPQCTENKRGQLLTDSGLKKDKKEIKAKNISMNKYIPGNAHNSPLCARYQYNQLF
jgi:hypothetical protein